MGTSQQRDLFEDYDGFVEKFKPKKTTDDCYTPPEVMEVVNAYVSGRWHLDPATFVRPFWPGGDYERFDYPEGCAVVDNPPFSMLAKTQAFYLEAGIPFFLFAPALTILSARRCMDVCHIVCDANITYENGAVVRTGFVTNLEPDNVLEADPDLGDALNAVSDRLRREKVKELPRYDYPMEVVTAARAQWYAAHHTPYRVRRADAARITALDSQRAAGKSIFGGGLLLSERAAAERADAERAAAERAAARRWPLSEREREMSRMLGRR